MSTQSKRTHRYEKLARIYDREILPIWSQRFGRMLLRGLVMPEKGQVLDVACGTGYPSVELLRKMGDGCRLIAIDASSAMLDVARKKIAETGKKGVFFRTESAQPRLSFADDVYDLVVCNLGVSEMPDPPGALADLARVTRPDGEVRVTMPLAGTFQEFFDIYREVLVKHDKHETLEALAEHTKTFPTPEECEAWMRAAGLHDHRVEIEEFTLLFKSSREFFFAPVIEYGPLPGWKRIAGKGQELQDVFWYIKEAIDAYFGDRAFEITVKAGCLIGRKVEETEEAVTGKMDPIFPDDVVGEGEIEIDMDTSEVEIAEEIPIRPFELEADEFADVELDAFVEGRERPEHLDD